MTVLAELARLCERLQEQGKAPAPGYSMEKIGGEVVLDAEGHVLAIRDLRTPDQQGRPQLRVMAVPAPPTNRRGKKIVAGTLWDPAAYCLGAEFNKETSTIEVSEKTSEKFGAFRQHHLQLLENNPDAGLRAISAFVRSWKPKTLVEQDFDPALLDLNLVFRLEGDEVDGKRRFIHERPSAWEFTRKGGKNEDTHCLVTGEKATAARLHPAIKFPDPNAQSSGAYLVSFNIGSKSTLGASSSYGKTQGQNAPVSEGAAFAYGTALNALLAKGSGRNLRIGDATVVFWVEAARSAQAESIEDLLTGALAPDEQTETNKLRSLLQNIAAGRGTAPEGFAPETRVFILGLAPNAARLSLRFWRPGTLGDFAKNIIQFWDDLALTPPAWNGPPAASSLLVQTVVKHWDERTNRWKYETYPNTKIPAVRPRLGGDLMQAVLTGAPYPRTLLTATVNRIRSDHDINGRRVAIIAAVLRRNLKEEIPMSLDRNNPDPAYRLGRLFAVLEGIQQSGLPGLNATIKDRYFAAASATPARVFPLLVKTATHHLSNLRKADKAGLAHWFEAEMGEIWSALEADLPRSLNLEDQGRFIAGYYHQRWAGKEQPEDTADKAIETEGAPE